LTGVDIFLFTVISFPSYHTNVFQIRCSGGEDVYKIRRLRLVGLIANNPYGDEGWDEWTCVSVLNK